MLLRYTLFGACALLGSAHASKKPQSPLIAPAPSCKDVTPAAGVQCTFYAKDPTLNSFRTTLLAFPKTWSSDQVDLRPYPLILSFHGHGGNSTEQQLLTGLSQNDINAFAAYPQGKRDEWQGDPSADTNDVEYVKSLINTLLGHAGYGIDPSRVYATGKSNGGGLLNILACDAHLSSTIAAFAAVSGAFYVNGTGEPSHPLVLPTCSPNNASRAVPFMEFHGTSDCTIPYLGGLNKRGSGTSRPVFDVVTSWANQRNCVADDISSVGSCDIQRYSWTCNGVSDTVVHYKIPSLMHDWPNINGNADCRHPNVKDTDCMDGYCNTCIEATPIITAWLQKFSIVPEELASASSKSPKVEL